MKINGQRLLNDLRELKSFGEAGTGVVRESFSSVDLESRYWLMMKLEQAGLKAELDGVGNVIGRVPDASQALLMGSHTDTQPEGGWLDGAMGVVYALEIARSLREIYGAKYAVDVASWMDEEGRFLTGLGSRSFCGKLDPEEIDAAVDISGVPLRQAIKEAGLESVLPARLDPDRYIGYLEGHIEQGCVLENRNKRIGVVTSIVGGAFYQITLTGKQNHAGTTPMSMRQDAGMAFVELAYEINTEFQKIASDDSVWTIGEVTFKPGGLNTIPGEAEFYLEFRDPSQGVVQLMIEKVEALCAAINAEGHMEIQLKPLGSAIPPSLMSDELQRHITDSAEQHCPGNWISMPSGAGHDAAVFADLIPTGMLFVPSIGGISHCFDENTEDDDIVLGCEVMADAVVAIFESRK